jgi:hypothetical protein
VAIVDGRHRGAALRPGLEVRWIAQGIVLMTALLGLIALLVWLQVSVTTPREGLAFSGLLLAVSAIGAFVRERGRNAFRWWSAGLALAAALAFIDAAVLHRHAAFAYRVVGYSIGAIGVYLGTSIVLRLRSARPRLRRPFERC